MGNLGKLLNVSVEKNSSWHLNLSDFNLFTKVEDFMKLRSYTWPFHVEICLQDK